MPDRFVAEITVVIDSGGTEETFYFATSGFSSTPSDTPANTYVAARLKNPGSYRRELFSGNRVFGAVRPSFGEIVLFNNDGGLDDWAGYGVSGGKVVVRLGDEGAAYPSGYTSVYIGYINSLVADFSEIRLRLRDRLHKMDTPLVTESFDGGGGLDGTQDATDKLKQWINSDPAYHPIILLDPAKQLYFVQSTSPGTLASLFALYEGGIEITRGTDYPDESTALSTSPSAGECRFYFGATGDGPVYVRLGSVPQFDLRVVAFGNNPATNTQWRIPEMAELAGITGGTGSVSIGAQLVDDNRTILDVCEDAASSQFGFFGMDRGDNFISDTFEAPSASPSYTFTEHNAKDWRRVPINGMESPVWQVTINSGKRWPGNVASGATATLRDRVTREPWWMSAVRQNAATLTAFPGAEAVTLEFEGRFFQNQFSVDNFTDDYFNLFGVLREFYECTVQMTADTLALDLHDTVEIKLPRYGLSSGKNFRIVTEMIDCQNRTITFGMWG